MNKKGASAPFLLPWCAMHFSPTTRLRFACGYALRHLLISVCVALLAALFVFGLLYPPPFSSLLGVGSIFVLLLAVDVVCGPLLTLILANPQKSTRERTLDFSLIGCIQIIALAYGMFSVWQARPVALVFEVDRLVVVTANEVQVDQLPQAPTGLQHLPLWGVLQAGTRSAQNPQELLSSIELGMAGISPAMRPDWWQNWDSSLSAMRSRARPLSDLMAQRPTETSKLEEAAQASSLDVQALHYLPLVSSKNLEWVALLNADMQMVGWAPVDGFTQ